jgi:deoxyribose-phosphate aldolase|uniref:deoxyribose-phosphate aldolase n=1 Tax=Polaribacter sp. TaxID=1920175 RepID=UPI004048D641
MRLSSYIDSTYLKTSNQAGISEDETQILVEKLIQEAIEYRFKSVMIRAEYISLAKQLIQKANSQVLIGTVIGFHDGLSKVTQKLKEIETAISLGADEVDVVINFEAFKRKEFALVTEEVILCTRLALNNGKVIKWIIETASLNTEEISNISALIKDLVLSNFSVSAAQKVFVKSSTGFYKTPIGVPNGATFISIKTMVTNARPLKIKAAGGVKTKEDLLKMITLGVDRIGTSSAKKILDET